MTNVLKNKASFYQFTDELALPGFYPPDYTIANIFDVAQEAERFLQQIEEIYKTAGVAGMYPSGVMLRAAEEDGNYGCCLVYEDAEGIIVIPNGDADHAHRYRYWREALVSSQEHLLTTMNVQKEMRVVMSRYIDFVDSPGMSVVIMDDRWCLSDGMASCKIQAVKRVLEQVHIFPKLPICSACNRNMKSKRSLLRSVAEKHGSKMRHRLCFYSRRGKPGYHDSRRAGKKTTARKKTTGGQLSCRM